MKIALGTANFGIKYGTINNDKLKKKDIKKIEKSIKNLNVKFIDTASDYRNSEKIIGNSGLRRLKIISKIKIPKKTKKIENYINKRILNSLKQLKVKTIFGLLIHNTDDLFNNETNEILLSLKKFKKKKIIKNIGISIYSPDELDKIWKFWKPDIVQVPFNVFDQRINESGWLNRLSKNKTKIFVRSCFLQGLLVNNFSSSKFSRNSNNLFLRFHRWCYENNITRLKACLDFVRQFDKIDSAVIGFDNYEQFENVLEIMNSKKYKIPKVFSSNNLKLIDPRKW